MSVSAPELGSLPTPPPARPRPSGRGRRRAPWPLALGAPGVAVAMLVPAGYLALRASDAGWTAFDIATGSRSLSLLWQSAFLAGAVSVAAVVIAVPLAWLTTRTDLPGRRVWVVLTALPLVLPSYLFAYAFVAALGPTGLVQGWLEPLGVHRLPPVYGFPGAFVVLTLVAYPYVLLPVRAALAGLDPSLEEASLALGDSPRETFRRVVLPQLRPAVGAGALLVALYTLSDFGAVSLLRYDSFTRAIYLQHQASFDRTPAAVLSLVLVALCLVVVGGEGRMRGRATYHRSHGTAGRRARLAHLGAWRWPALAVCGAVVGAALVLPVGIVTYWLVRGLSQGADVGVTWQAARHSVEASALGAAVIVALAWPVAHLSARYPGRLAVLSERAAYAGHALPGIVVALSLVFLGTRTVPALYQTRTLLVFAYVVLFLPLAVGTLRASLLQVSPAVEDASRSLGRGWTATVLHIVLPMVRPGIVAAFSLSFLTVMKELPATLLLAPTGYDTLATRLWGASSEAFFAKAAVPAMMLVLLSSVPLAVLVSRDTRAERS